MGADHSVVLCEHSGPELRIGEVQRIGLKILLDEGEHSVRSQQRREPLDQSLDLARGQIGDHHGAHHEVVALLPGKGKAFRHSGIPDVDSQTRFHPFSSSQSAGRAHHGVALVDSVDPGALSPPQNSPRQSTAAAAHLQNSRLGLWKQGCHQLLEHRPAGRFSRASLHTPGSELGLSRQLELFISIDPGGPWALRLGHDNSLFSVGRHPELCILGDEILSMKAQHGDIVPMNEKKSIPVWGWIAMGCGCLLVVASVALTAGGFFVAKKAGDFVEELEANPARTAAELFVRANPDLELVSTDDEAGTMTIRNRTNDEVATLDFDDIAEGRFRWTTGSGDEGSITFDGEDGARITTTNRDGESQSVELTAEEDGGVVVRGTDFEARLGGEGDIPSWVPLPPGAQPQTTFASSNQEGTSGAFTFSSEESVEDLAAFYRRALEEAGFEIESSSMTTSEIDREALDAKRGQDSAKLFVTVARGTGIEGTQVVVQYEQLSQ